MKSFVCLLALMFAVPQSPSKTFPVDSTSVKQRDFASFRTYAWAPGHEAFDRAAHKMIVAAVDSEMKGLGFTQAEAAKADVTIRYHSVLSTEVDLKALDKMGKEAAGKAPTNKLGVLAVAMHDRPGQQIWAAKTRAYVDTTGSPDQTIRTVVQRLFETYPTRKSGSGKS
jgi:Domain of unknown function (DUF4136)